MCKWRNVSIFTNRAYRGSANATLLGLKILLVWCSVPFGQKMTVTVLEQFLGDDGSGMPPASEQQVHSLCLISRGLFSSIYTISRLVISDHVDSALVSARDFMNTHATSVFAPNITSGRSRSRRLAAVVDCAS